MTKTDRLPGHGAESFGRPRLQETFSKRLDAEKKTLEAAFTLAKEVITPERVLKTAEKIAEVRRPSGSVQFTLGPILHDITRDLGIDPNTVTYDANFRDTGNPALILKGKSAQEQTIFAHGDEVSYAIKNAGTTEAQLIPLCAHRQKATDQAVVSFPGELLRCREDNLGHGYMEMVGFGDIVTDPKGSISFSLKNGEDSKILSQAGLRVVFQPLPQDVRKNSNTRLIIPGINKNWMVGQIDNSVGIASSLHALAALTQLYKDAPKTFGDITTVLVIDDSEEGNPDGPLFGEGAFRLARANDRASINSQYFVFDGHDSESINNIPPTALLSDVISNGKSFALDPQRAYHIDQTFGVVRAMNAGIEWDFQRNAVTSRSSDWGLLRAGVSSDQVLALGYPEYAPHYNELRPAIASLPGVVEAGRALVTAVIASGKRLI